MTQTFDSAAAMVEALRPDSPVYCLRPQVLRETARRYVEAFPGTVMYAVKCNDDRRVLRALYEGGIRHFDTASLPEVKAVNDQFPQPVCHFMHPVKSRRAIAEAYFDYGVRSFVLDHRDELAKIMEMTENAADLTLVVRIEAPRNQAVCDLSGKFGAGEEDAAALLGQARDRAARIGMTFHVGSQCLAPLAYTRAIELAGRARARSGVDLDLLDIGGGFPVPYVGVEPPPIEDYVTAIRDGIATAGLPADIELLCEPGRALVAAGCSMVVQVELRRDNALYLNEGMYGSLSDMRFDGIDFPMRVIRPDGRPSERLAGFNLFGPTCDSTDSMPGPYWLPEDIREGDWLEIGQMGAYTNVLRTRFNGFHARTFVFARDAAFLPTRDMLPNKLPRRAAA